MAIRELQLGKNNLTKEVLQTILEHFEKSKNIKISVLSSCCRDKQELKKIEDQISKFLGDHYKIRSIGYKINIKKFNKKVN